MRLTCAISFVLMLLVAGTLTICSSDALSARNVEFGSAKALFDDCLKTPHASRLVR